MKLIKRTPNELTMRFRPLTHWIIASCLISIGGYVLLVGGHWGAFKCSRDLALPTQGKCTLTDHHWVIRSQRSWQLEQIKQIQLEITQRDRNGEPKDYRILLDTTQGVIELPLVEVSHANTSKGKVESIRQFLENPLQPNLIEQVDERLEIVYLFSTFGGIGGLFILIGQTVILRINKRTQKLIVQRCYPLGKQTIEYHLNQISDVIVQEKRNIKGLMIGRVVIMLTDGRQVIVHPYDWVCIALMSHLCVENIRTFLRRPLPQ